MCNRTACLNVVSSSVDWLEGLEKCAAFMSFIFVFVSFLENFRMAAARNPLLLGR
jgi:hypothetical protein